MKQHSGSAWLIGVNALVFGATAAQAAANEELAEITVTGSRIITNGNDSPTPVTVVSVEQLQLANPGPIAQALTQLPALLATPNQGGQGGGNQAVINLRGIGGARNLILFDGHRIAPTTVNTGGGGVDTNLIPQMLLKRVDIVTGGASAVYGSDAVSGVVNYIVDNNFNGVKFVGQTGISKYNDDRTYNIGIAAGMPVFDGRGHIEFSYQNFNDPGVPSRYRRDWGRELWSAQGSVVQPAVNPAGAGTQANPWGLYSNTRINVTSFGGLINSGPLLGLQFAQNGVLAPFVRGTPTGSAQVDIGGDGGYYTSVTAFAGQNMNQAFARVDYEFSDTVQGYAELAGSTVLNWINLANSEVRSRQIGYNNPFLGAVQPNHQATIAAQRAANPLGTFNFSRIISQLDVFPAPRTEIRETQYLFLSGLDGSWGRYRWNLGYERSDALMTQFNPFALSNPRLFAAMNAVVNPANNQIVCNAALVNPAVYGNCVPLNLFGPTASSQAAFDYIRAPNRSANKWLMDEVTASITGAPFSSWAGPVDMALSGEWRTLSYAVNSDARPSDPISCFGIQFNCVATGPSATTPYTTSAAVFPKSRLSVAEFAYETQVPLLKDQFLVKSLGFNGAARHTNYSTSGVVWSWKLGLTWALNDSLTVRAARSRDIRAPTLQNLFAPQTFRPLNITDSHTGITGTINQIDQGNPNLTPEKADTWTAGFVWTPTFLAGLSVSLDGYHVKINEGLVVTSAAQPAGQAACENSGGASPICDLFIRPFPFSNKTPANFPTAIVNITMNSAGLLVYGLDAEVNYARAVAGHQLSLRALANFQPHLIYDFGPGGIFDVGGAADGVSALPPTPNVKVVLQESLGVFPGFTATLQERYRNALRQNGSALLFFAIGKQPPTWYADLTLDYKLKAGGGDMETFLTVRNLFNKQPDPWASTGGSAQIGSFGGWAQGDDPLGRYYSLGLRYKL